MTPPFFFGASLIAAAGAISFGGWQHDMRAGAFVASVFNIAIIIAHEALRVNRGGK